MIVKMVDGQFSATTMKELENDLRHFTDPTSLSYGDGYFQKSIQAKYGKPITELMDLISKLKDEKIDERRNEKMNQKKEKMVVEDLRHINGKVESCFKVKKVTNTIDFQIDQYLSAKEVGDLIDYRPSMTVEIVPQKK